MALGGVFMSDTDGNIGTSSTTSTEKVTGLLFPNKLNSSKKVLVWP